MSPPGRACHFSVLTVIMRHWLLLWFRGIIAGLDSFASALEACKVVSGSGPMGLVSEALGVISNWDLTFCLYGPTKGSNNNL